MKQYTRGLVLSILLVLSAIPTLSGASLDSSPEQKTVPARPITPQLSRTLDDLFAAVATQVPAFGGMFLGEDEQSLQVYLTDISPNQIKQVQKAIVAIFGAAVIPKGGIKALKAKYGFLQLRDWYTRMAGDILSTPGVTATDINEAVNRLIIGLETHEVEVRVLEKIARLNIPPRAVAIVVTGPIEPLSHTLNDAFSPRQGGYQVTRLINNMTGFGITQSTLGFNAIRNGVPGFATCSHSTQVLWNLDSLAGYPPADFYQAPGFFPNQWVGTESVDPQGFPCLPPHPPGYKCRYSDSAFVTYNTGVVWDPGIIAQTTGITTLSTTTANLILTVDHSAKFRIVAPPSKPYLSGLQLDKVGRTTGWTTGAIEYAYFPSTCADFVDANQNVRLCQYVVGDPQLGIATFGDSGSPVFRIHDPQCGYVELYGILWGGFDFFVPPSPWMQGSVGRRFVFSPIGGVSFQQTGVQSPEDLGPLNYVALPNACACIPPPANLIAWWPLDEASGATSFQDVIGGNNATPFASAAGAPQSPLPVSGKVDGAIHFPKFGNGLSGARVGPQGALAAIGSADFTIDAWVKFEPAPANRLHYIVNKFDQNKGYAFYVISPGITGNERLGFKWGDGNNVSTVQTISPVTPTQWHHVAVTFARGVSGNALDIRMYVDGIQQGQQVGNPPGLGSLVNFIVLEIGWQPSPIDEPITIDELEIFNRALMQQEIQALFNADSAGKCK